MHSKQCAESLKLSKQVIHIVLQDLGLLPIAWCGKHRHSLLLLPLIRLFHSDGIVEVQPVLNHVDGLFHLVRRVDLWLRVGRHRWLTQESLVHRQNVLNSLNLLPLCGTSRYWHQLCVWYILQGSYRLRMSLCRRVP